MEGATLLELSAAAERVGNLLNAFFGVCLASAEEELQELEETGDLLRDLECCEEGLKRFIAAATGGGRHG